MIERRDLARRIDHTLLKPEATEADVRALVAEALGHGFAAVCVNPVFVPLVRGLLDDGSRTGGTPVPLGNGSRTGGTPVPLGNGSRTGGTPVPLGDASRTGETPVPLGMAPVPLGGAPALCTVASFPLGAATVMQRAIEATQSVKAGAEEIDLVAWLPRLIARDAAGLRGDLIETVRAVRAARPSCVVKVIIESAALRAAASSDDEFEAMIAAACAASREAGCDYVKTSTGFHPAGGATIEAVRLMKKHAGGLKVKASGGIRDYATASAMIDAGADRVGASASVAIVAAAPASI